MASNETIIMFYLILKKIKKYVIIINFIDLNAIFTVKIYYY